MPFALWHVQQPITTWPKWTGCHASSRNPGTNTGMLGESLGNPCKIHWPLESAACFWGWPRDHPHAPAANPAASTTPCTRGHTWKGWAPIKPVASLKALEKDHEMTPKQIRHVPQNYDEIRVCFPWFIWNVQANSASLPRITGGLRSSQIFFNSPVFGISCFASLLTLTFWVSRCKGKDTLLMFFANPIFSLPGRANLGEWQFSALLLLIWLLGVCCAILG